MRLLLPSLFPSTNAGASDPASGAWLITFTDLVGLMLAFFIMMYAMSKLDEQRWGRMVDQLGVTPGAASDAAQQSQAPTEVPVAARGRDIGYLAVLLPHTIAEQPALAGARLVPGAGRVEIVLPQATLLKLGTSDLSPSAAATIDAIVPILANLPNAVRIEAHVGGRTLQPQAWTQAVAGAQAVAAALSAAGYTRPLEARSYLTADAAGADSISFVILE